MKQIFPDNSEWSRWLATSQAAPLLSKSPDALRAWIRAYARGRTDFQQDGVRAKKIGRIWRISVHRSWVV